MNDSSEIAPSYTLSALSDEPYAWSPGTITHGIDRYAPIGRGFKIALLAAVKRAESKRRRP